MKNKEEIIRTFFTGIVKISIYVNDYYVYTKNISMKSTYLSICKKELKCKDIEILMPHDNKDMGFIYKISF